MFTLTELVLIVCLGHDSFAVREAAQKSLDNHMDKCLYDRMAYFKSGDLETERRVQFARERYEQKLVRAYEAALKGYKDYPFIDSLPDGYVWNGMTKQEIVSKYLGNTQWCQGSEYPQWYNYRQATRTWFHDRKFEDTELLRKELGLLIAGDDAYWQKCRQPNPMR
jgi:hypothetical protein